MHTGYPTSQRIALTFWPCGFRLLHGPPCLHLCCSRNAASNCQPESPHRPTPLQQPSTPPTRHLNTATTQLQLRPIASTAPLKRSTQAAPHQHNAVAMPAHVAPHAAAIPFPRRSTPPPRLRRSRGVGQNGVGEKGGIRGYWGGGGGGDSSGGLENDVYSQLLCAAASPLSCASASPPSLCGYITAITLLLLHGLNRRSHAAAVLKWMDGVGRLFKCCYEPGSRAAADLLAPLHRSDHSRLPRRDQSLIPLSIAAAMPSSRAAVVTRSCMSLHRRCGAAWACNGTQRVRLEGRGGGAKGGTGGSCMSLHRRWHAPRHRRSLAALVLLQITEQYQLQ